MKQLSLIIFVFFLVGVGYFYWQNKQVPVLENLVTKNLPNPNSLTQSSAKKTDLSNWKTYTNKELGFSISYPPEDKDNSFHVSSAGPNDFTSSVDVGFNLNKSPIVPTPLDGYYIVIETGKFIAPEKGNVLLTTAKEVLDHYYPGDKQYGKATSIVKTMIGNKGAYTYTTLSAISQSGYYETRYFTSNDAGQLFSISVGIDSPQPEKIPQYKKTTDDILSTIKFL